MNAFRIALALLPALLSFALHAREARAENVVFVTRHAEKSLDVPGDAAPLLPKGTDRARALAHLLANHTLADLLLFGGFLAWAVLSFRAARARDRAAGTVRPRGSASATAITVAVGLGAWMAFAMWLHEPLIGVRPFG